MHGPNRAPQIYYETRGRGRPFFLFHASPSDHARAMAQVEPVFACRTGRRRAYPDPPAVRDPREFTPRGKIAGHGFEPWIYGL